MDVAVTYPTMSTAPVVVSLRGQLDIDSAARLSGAFQELADRQVVRVIVDLAGLEFCDSIGLSTIIIGHRRCTAAGGWLNLAAPSPFLLRLLSVVGIAEAIPVYASVEGARRRAPADRIMPAHDLLIDDLQVG